MGLFKRIGDIISANLGEMAERFEDPELMLKQAIREMEESIQKATEETARAMASQKRLQREKENNEIEAKQWRQRAEKAVSAGDDDLARKALLRKKEHDQLTVALNDQLTSAADASETLRHQLDGMKAKLSEAKRNLAALSARNKAAQVRKKAYTAKTETGKIGLNDDAFQKFEHLREKVEMAEAEAEALAELHGVEPTGRSKNEGATSATDIDSELEELKRSLKRD